MLRNIALILIIAFSCKSSDESVIVKEMHNKGTPKKIIYVSKQGFKTKEEVFYESGILSARTLYSLHDGDSIIQETSYTEKGEKKATYYTVNKNPKKITLYNKKGGVFSEEIFHSDGKSESMFYWFENDKKKARFINDSLFEYYEKFYKDENIQVRGRSKYGLEDSLWTFYSPEGELVQEILYNQGKVIEKKVYDQAVVDSLFSDD